VTLNFVEQRYQQYKSTEQIKFYGSNLVWFKKISSHFNFLNSIIMKLPFKALISLSTMLKLMSEQFYMISFCPVEEQSADTA